MIKHAKILDLQSTIGSNKFIVIGDIHGCYDEFICLLQKCKYQTGDFLISVGDLVDRGPKSREVIQWFLSSENCWIVEGNHDNKIKRYWNGHRVKITNGLDETIEQCKNMDTGILAQWIESWPHIIQVPHINKKPAYVVHAGIDGNIPINHQPVENCLYARYLGGKNFLDESGNIWYNSLDHSCIILSGHMIHKYSIPINCPCVYLLDGGAYQGGVLRAAIIENGEVNIMEVQSQNYEKINQSHKNKLLAVLVRDNLVKQGLLRCDDKKELRIYTYTDNCTHSGSWDNITMNSRGIILNRKTGEIIARPFSKFFNMNEKTETMEMILPWKEPYLVFEKMDGWLGILYRYEGEYHIATRGSFDGMGLGTWATKYLRQHHDLTNLPEEVTLVFEIICPQTHIIVDYKEKEELVLLAAFNRHSGKEYEWDQVVTWSKEFSFPLPRVFKDDINSCKDILAAHPGNEMEGFVVRFENGMRVKIKSEDYRRRATIVANLTPLSLWRVIHSEVCNKKYNGNDPFAKLTSMRKTIDQDYIEQFDEITENLRTKFHKLIAKINKDFTTIENLTNDRKKFALTVKARKLTHMSAMFALLDKKLQSVHKYVVKLIRP